MALKEFRPLTPTLRFKSLPAFDEITKWRPERRLVEPKKKSGGRNSYGRLTSRHIGGGHKQKYRKVDFARRKREVSAEVIGIEYDPNRSARIALIKYADGELSYILAPNGLRVGSTVTAGDDVAPELGNALPLRAIPLGTNVHNIELSPGRGGQVARSAGQEAAAVIIQSVHGDNWPKDLKRAANINRAIASFWKGAARGRRLNLETREPGKILKKKLNQENRNAENRISNPLWIPGFRIPITF